MSNARSPLGLVSITMGMMLWGTNRPLFWGDVIVVDLPPDAIAGAATVAETVPDVDAVTQGRRGITIATADGAATVGSVAVALSGAGFHPQSLTVRTPSLDDVFLLATGYRMSALDPAAEGGDGAGGSGSRAAAAGSGGP